MTQADAMDRLLAQMTDDERMTLYQMRDALNLQNNDALWSLLLALGHFERLYSRFPKMIADAARDATATARETAAAQAQASAAAVKRGLVHAVAAAGAAAASGAARAQVLKWTAACSVVITVSLAGCAWAMFRRGERVGYHQASAEAHREQGISTAACNWANTPEGRLAFGLAQVGSVRELAECSGRGWTSKDGVCFVQPEKGKTYGWRIPGGQGKGR